MTAARTLVLALLLLVAPVCALAQQATAPQPATTAAVPWSGLSPAQRQLFAPLADRWASLPPAKQQALARGSRRWLAMTPAEKAKARQRFKQWQRMTPQQRALLRDRWRQFKALPPAQRSAIRRSFRQFQQLPQWRRRMLQQRWRNATPAERQQMIDRMHRGMRMRQRMMQPLDGMPDLPPGRMHRRCCRRP